MVENYFTKQLWLERRNLHIKRTKCVLKFGVRNWQSIMQLFAIDDKMYNDNFVEGVKGNFWGKVSLFGYHFFVINRQLLRTNCLFLKEDDKMRGYLMKQVSERATSSATCTHPIIFPLPVLLF